tara:strand:+ start:92 stop:1411 length:1320 start_codon:yes stop_codon:yes gene_type:complete
MVIAIIPPVIAQELKNLPFSENIFVVYNHQLRMGEGEGLVLIKSAGDVEISVGLQSTSNDEFTFSDSLIERINQESSVQSIVFTNMEEIDQNGDLIGCVPGVKGGNQCILINLDFEQIKKFITDEDRNEMDGNVKRVQIETKRIGNSLIDEINQEFQSNAKFHSVYIQKGNEDVDLEKVIEGTISAVYIMPKQNSMELFDKFSNLFISKKISGGGGFYDIANDLSNDETYGITRYEGQIAGPSIEFSTVAMTIFSDNDETRYMLNTSTKYYNVTPNISEIKPLDPLFINELKRSSYFDNEFTPLNSILDVLIFTDEGYPIKIDSANTHVIEKISAIEDIAKKGWFFEQSHGNFVAGKFLFGQSNSVSGDDLIFYTSAWDEVSPVSIQSSLLEETVEEQSPEEKIVGEESEQSQYAILAVIIVVAIAAAIYYMKGYKSKH